MGDFSSHAYLDYLAYTSVSSSYLFQTLLKKLTVSRSYEHASDVEFPSTSGIVMTQVSLRILIDNALGT